ncbi:hypothetical protein SPACI_028920 [Sporomusa acidovorans DSM 3132]|uniref:Uncharacterized protein n=2 Tax=Sporomusa TaxID=2375 RepID=A0ABZ3J439_SPOA4|nr:hypothetical protein [Sporomusa acidovorans]OZC20333.1 hypothetical protein SPACI_27320 [Sporomusa acidovorans DSM 3132]SDD37279.1 hypothetical protein SAMN04488499_100151 [Sporomusa acidovorans]
MLAIDIVGLLISICLVSIRYPHYAFMAAMVNVLGQIITAVLFTGNVEKFITAGVFSSAEVTNLGGLKTILFTFSGPITNFLLSKMAGGVEFVSTANIVNPFAVLKHPLAVINLRFAVVSFLLGLCQLL